MISIDKNRIYIRHDFYKKEGIIISNLHRFLRALNST